MNSKYENKKEFLVNTVYLITIFLIVYYALKYGLGMISPFVLAFVISYFLNKPAKDISDKLKIKKSHISIALVTIFYTIIFVFFSLVGVNIISMLTSIFLNLPKNYSIYIEPILSSMVDNIENIMIGLDVKVVNAIESGFNQVIKSLGENVTNLSISLVSSLSSIATSLPSFLIKILLMIISTFFIAVDYEKITDFMSRQFSEETNKYINIIRDYIVNTLFVVIKSYLIIMTITFVELSILLTFIGIKNSIIIALFIAIFDIMPVLGTGGIMIPWGIISLIQGNIRLGISLLIIYVIVTIIRNIIEPRIVGGELGLHPVVTLISMFVGTSLFGVIGLFGMPIFLSLLKHLNDTGAIKLIK